MKASQLLKGKRAVHRVRLPICNFRCSILPDIPELAEQREKDRAAWIAEHNGEDPNENEVEVGVRVLTGLELADVLERSLAFAKARGVEKPEPDNAIYDLGVSVNTLAIACVDPDYPDSDSPDARFFDGGVDQILSSPHLGRDGIVYLREQQESWQDQCSPQAKKLDVAQFDSLLDELAGPEGFRFFCMLGPALRWNCMRSMAVLLSTVQIARSTLSFTSDESGSELPNQPLDSSPMPSPVAKEAKPAKRRASKRKPTKSRRRK